MRARTLPSFRPVRLLPTSAFSSALQNCLAALLCPPLCRIQNKSFAYLPVSPPVVPSLALPDLAALPASSLLPCLVPRYLPGSFPSSVRSARLHSFESPLQTSSVCLFPPASAASSAYAARHTT